MTKIHNAEHPLMRALEIKMGFGVDCQPTTFVGKKTFPRSYSKECSTAQGTLSTDTNSKVQMVKA